MLSISCSAKDKLGSEIQDSQTQTEQTNEESRQLLTTNLPIWGTETTELNFPIDGKYRDENIWSKLKEKDDYNTAVSTVGENTEIKGTAMTLMPGGGMWGGPNYYKGLSFSFTISKWNKTTEGKKTTKLEAVAENIENMSGVYMENITIIYYPDTLTLNITFGYIDGGYRRWYSFNGTKQPFAFEL